MMTTASEFIKLHGSAIDITGQRYGRLVALGPVGKSKSNSILWLCQCDCDVKVSIEARYLRHFNVTSCGCLDRGQVRPSRSLYLTWSAMIRRCHDEKSHAYAGYGGRGILVYAPWRNSLEEFLFYVAQLPYFEQEGYTLDRINNDGSYEPGNVRWATKTEQGRNMRSNRMIAYNSKVQCLKAWEEETGIRRETLYYRLGNGWTVEAALTTPIRGSDKDKRQ